MKAPTTRTSAYFDIRRNADVQTAYLGDIDVPGPATVPA